MSFYCFKPSCFLLLLLLLQVMDKHIALLCRQHLETKFVKVRSSTCEGAMCRLGARLH